ncbi:hypothetical protein QR680_005301 [Steinernema hermaphroditum]|uniref:Uncharacterized protein n=1 Tax=Steinernema hermaphroditum TaxID=289476 RepID=A0AA39HSR1_9BILA|nr:hypothetical protein QR680_005301 [Steinernema hermaphroditum]
MVPSSGFEFSGLCILAANRSAPMADRRHSYQSPALSCPRDTVIRSRGPQHPMGNRPVRFLYHLFINRDDQRPPTSDSPRESFTGFHSLVIPRRRPKLCASSASHSSCLCSSSRHVPTTTRIFGSSTKTKPDLD